MQFTCSIIFVSTSTSGYNSVLSNRSCILGISKNLKLPINRFQDGNSEDDHEYQGEDCEADVDLEHVEDEDSKLEEVANDVRNFPGYDVHNNLWAHSTLQKHMNKSQK